AEPARLGVEVVPGLLRCLVLDKALSQLTDRTGQVVENACRHRNVGALQTREANGGTCTPCVIRLGKFALPVDTLKRAEGHGASRERLGARSQGSRVAGVRVYCQTRKVFRSGTA